MFKFKLKTQSWKTTLILLVFFILFLVLWILIGEIDVLDVDYIVPKNGILWHGTITNLNKQWIYDHYHQYGITMSDIEALIGKTQTIINPGNLIFNPLLLAYLLPLVLLCIIVPILLRLIRFSNYDVIPFSTALGISCFIFIISDLIGYWDKQNMWLYLIRIFIMIISFAIIFMISNAIVGSIMEYSPYANQYINELKSEKIKADKINQSTSIFEDYQHQKDQDITSIEVKE